jgi:hypothetical protein
MNLRVARRSTRGSELVVAEIPPGGIDFSIRLDGKSRRLIERARARDAAAVK